jgi:RNA polymerase sigma-70 factor, ECF subfamily
MNHRATQEPSTHLSLLERAKLGNDDDWRLLVQVYGPLVYGWIRRCGAQPADAADVMQDTFLAVAKSLERFDAERPDATFRGWLWTIAKNRLRDRQRANGAYIGTGDPLTQQTLDHVAWDRTGCLDPPSSMEEDTRAIRWRMIEALRDSFEPKTWQMFWATMIEGRDAQDVADAMNVTRWTVYKARARVLQRLQQELRGFA